MAEAVKIVTSGPHATVVDLNQTSVTTGIRTIRVFPPDPQVMESELVSFDTPGGLLLKAQDMWSTWSLVLRIPAQTTMANLISKVNSVRDACLGTSNALEIKREGEATSRFFDIIPTRINPALSDDMDPVHFNAQLMVVRWQFELRTHPYDQSSTKPPVY